MRVSGIPYVQGRNAYTDADGTKYGIAIHNTANDATAEGEASYATRRTDGISAHFYADSNSVVQSLDTKDRAGHAGSDNGNQHAVAVEITGTNDKPRSWWLANVAWDRLGAVLAHVCRHYGIQVRRASVGEMDVNPRVKAFYSHNDMRLAWGGTTHTDPGNNFPWDRLFQAVNAALNGEDDDMDAAERKMLTDADWQIKNVPAPSGERKILTGAVGEIVQRLLAAEAKLAALAPATGLTPEQWAEVEARAEEKAAEEVAELRADLAELGTDEQ